MFLLLPAIAQSAELELFAWPHEVGAQRHLALAATTPLLDGHYVFEVQGPTRRSEVSCIVADQHATCTTPAGRVEADWNQAVQASGAWVFAGTRSNPSPGSAKRVERAKRKRDVADSEDEVPTTEPTHALVVSLPLSTLDTPGLTHVTVRKVERRWAAEVPRSSFDEPRFCEDHVLLTLEPDPWSTSTMLQLTVGSRTLLRRRGLPMMVAPRTAIAGALVRIDADPTRSCALTGATGEQLSCGSETLAVHLSPLCSTDPTETVFASAGRLAPLRPEKLDKRDGVVDHDPPVDLDGPLQLDTRHTCLPTASTFLEVERALATKRTPSTCGGRTPAGTARDTLLTYVVNGPQRLPPGAPLWGTASAQEAPRRRDGLMPPRPLDSFPFLAP